MGQANKKQRGSLILVWSSSIIPKDEFIIKTSKISKEFIFIKKLEIKETETENQKKFKQEDNLFKSKNSFISSKIVQNMLKKGKNVVLSLEYDDIEQLLKRNKEIIYVVELTHVYLTLFKKLLENSEKEIVELKIELLMEQSKALQRLTQRYFTLYYNESTSYTEFKRLIHEISIGKASAFKHNSQEDFEEKSTHQEVISIENYSKLAPSKIKRRKAHSCIDPLFTFFVFNNQKNKIYI